jgi:hypothetical protein
MPNPTDDRVPDQRVHSTPSLMRWLALGCGGGILSWILWLLLIQGVKSLTGENVTVAVGTLILGGSGVVAVTTMGRLAGIHGPGQWIVATVATILGFLGALPVVFFGLVIMANGGLLLGGY